MTKANVNIVLAGQAGQGLVTVGDFLARGLVRAGYEIVVTQDYMSRIRGGHNTYAVRVGVDEVLGPVEAIDLLVALDETGLARHRDRLTDRGMVLVDAGQGLAGLPGLAVPYGRLCPKPIFLNVAALGVLTAVLCLEQSRISGLVAEVFAGKGDTVRAANLEVFEAALAWAKTQNLRLDCLPPARHTEVRLTLGGSDALALGAMAAGVNFCSFYPMTPSTGVAQALIDQGQYLGVVVEQAEDEIAAVNMALGAAYVGARALVPTSGGGFDLMTEGVSLAGMTETPLVIVLGQRPGPATGLPTRTGQEDLNLAVYAGHGEFPRAVFAPGTVEQCFHLAHRAVDTAERFQTPVILLLDQYLADTLRAVVPFDLTALPPVTRPGLDCESPADYVRYAVTESGVSPRLIPGFGPYSVVLDSDEHTPDGHITEDLAVRVTMQDKRLAKLDGLTAQALAPDVYGDPVGATLVSCWGSTLGPALEAAARLRERGEPAAVLHFSQVFPLRPADFLPALTQAKRAVMVEGNATGQLARLIRQETGLAFDTLIGRYDGLPFTAQYILERLV